LIFRLLGTISSVRLFGSGAEALVRRYPRRSPSVKRCEATLALPGQGHCSCRPQCRVRPSGHSTRGLGMSAFPDLATRSSEGPRFVPNPDVVTMVVYDPQVNWRSLMRVVSKGYSACRPTQGRWGSVRHRLLILPIVSTPNIGSAGRMPLDCQ